jgi:Trk K+ transport system NAD-binding subunit
MAALVQQVLTKARLGIKRVIERAHQHQHAHALTALNPTAFDQLVNGAARVWRFTS